MPYLQGITSAAPSSERAHDDHAGNEAVNAVGGGFHGAMGENGDVALKEIGEPFHVLAADALGPSVVAPHGGDHLREGAHRSADAVEPLASVPLQIR